MASARKSPTKPQPAEDGDLVSTRQAAAICDVNPVTITRWAREGLLIPVHRFGQSGYMVFARSDVEAAAARWRAGTLR